MRRIRTATLAVLVVGGLSISSWAQPNTERYQLEERCGRQAREIFERTHGNGAITNEDGSGVCNFENHYNSRSNRCYILLRMIFMTKKYFQPSGGSTENQTGHLTLKNINENREIGFMRLGDKVMACAVLTSKCGSKEGF
jgi:hypothetical protein